MYGFILLSCRDILFVTPEMFEERQSAARKHKKKHERNT